MVPEEEHLWRDARAAARQAAALNAARHNKAMRVEPFGRELSYEYSTSGTATANVEEFAAPIPINFISHLIDYPDRIGRCSEVVDMCAGRVVNKTAPSAAKLRRRPSDLRRLDDLIRERRTRDERPYDLVTRRPSPRSTVTD